ncbi:MAG: metallophosphoesterase family protein [Chloroflexota bacterium]
MTSFVAFPDIHDRPKLLKQIRHVMADVDVVLLPGDMTNGNVENLHTILDMVSTYNEQIYAVCGNMDTVNMNMWLAREGISIHRKHVIVDDLAIIGCGGALPFYGKYVFSEDELAGFLEDSLVGVPENMPKVLVCHQPPYNTKLDVPSKSNQHVGSKAVRAFIERVQPLVCFTGHMHECVTIDRIGDTQIINPGPVWKSKKYAYAEIEDGVVTTLDIRDLKPLDLNT